MLRWPARRVGLFGVAFYGAYPRRVTANREGLTFDEMVRRTETRFLIITHHAVTMSRMDRLFGVTMQEQGVSQLVSVDLKKAEQMVA